MKGASYSWRIARLSARIFGETFRKTESSQLRVVKSFSRRPWEKDLVNWYPPIEKYNSLLFKLRHLGLYRDDHLDFVESMKSLRKSRGKGPPKKGQGRRTKKGK